MQNEAWVLTVDDFKVIGGESFSEAQKLRNSISWIKKSTFEKRFEKFRCFKREVIKLRLKRFIAWWLSFSLHSTDLSLYYSDDETVYVKNVLETRRRKTTFHGTGRVDKRFLMPAMLHPYFVCGKMLCDTIPRSLFSHPKTSLTLKKPETIQSLVS